MSNPDVNEGGVYKEQFSKRQIIMPSLSKPDSNNKFKSVTRTEQQSAGGLNISSAVELSRGNLQSSHAGTQL